MVMPSGGSRAALFTLMLATPMLLGAGPVTAEDIDDTVYYEQQKRTTTAEVVGLHCFATDVISHEVCLGVSNTPGIRDIQFGGAMTVTLTEGRNLDCFAGEDGVTVSSYYWSVEWADAVSHGTDTQGMQRVLYVAAAQSFFGSQSLTLGRAVIETGDIEFGDVASLSAGTYAAEFELGGVDELTGEIHHTYEGSGLATVGDWEAQAGTGKCADNDDQRP